MFRIDSGISEAADAGYLSPSQPPCFVEVGAGKNFPERKIRFFGKFSVSGATRKVFSGQISDFSVSKLKNSKKIIKNENRIFRPDFVAFRSDFGAFRSENIVLAM